MTAHFRAAFTPTTLDENTRSVDLLASTGAGVTRADYEGPFEERLDVSPEAVDLSRLNGMPLLDTHRQDGLDRVLGLVVGARFESGNLIVRVQFSARAEAIWQDVKAGIIRNVSIGYAPQKFRDSQDAKGARVRTITRWELREVSLVPVGADPAAKVRSSMTENMTADAPAPEIRATTQSQQVETRAAVNAEIRALGTTFDLGSDWANRLIDQGASEGDARAAALATLGTRQAQRPIITAGHVGAHDDPTQFRSLASEALYATRVNPRHKLPDAARTYASMTTLDLARECLRRASVSTVGMSSADTITRALTTSDFPAIFASTTNRTLQEAYQLAPNVLKKLARQSTAKDFRTKTKVKFEDEVKLQAVGERGEYKYNGAIDAQETYAIGTYGGIISITRKMIINDDLGAFVDLAAKLGIASAEFEAETLVGLLTANAGLGPAMSGGIRLFDAAHGNLGTAASFVSLVPPALSNARLAMRRQTGMNGRPIAVTPKYLLVPPELETLGERELAAIQPTKSEDVNPFAGKLELLVEPRLTNPTQWYLAGDPGLVEGLEYSYLQGFEGPQTETRQGFEVDGLDIKVRLDYGAAFLDWRSWYMNPGQVWPQP